MKKCVSKNLNICFKTFTMLKHQKQSHQYSNNQCQTKTDEGGCKVLTIITEYDDNKIRYCNKVRAHERIMMNVYHRNTNE